MPAIPRNLGTADRVLRALVAVIIGFLWYRGIITGWPAVVLMMVAGGLLLNSLMGRCGLYAALGLSTCKIPAPPQTSRKDSGKSSR
ncbi:MAG TPA: DUF2892 domain-containing protein [Alphaproteobacteria bacterium]|mgnify:CR=1 FL=1|nr:DUF2892 domain-containing protein [Alphaproteobacteria bacterium]